MPVTTSAPTSVRTPKPAMPAAKLPSRGKVKLFWMFFLLAFTYATGAVTGLLLGYRQGKADGTQAVTAKVNAYTARRGGAMAQLGVMGTVVAVRGDSIDVDSPPNYADPLSDGKPMRRTVSVGKDAKIVMQKLKDAAAFAKERETYAAEMKKASEGPSADMPHISFPSPYEEVELTIGDVKAGMHLTASSDGADGGQQFVASRIMISEDLTASPEGAAIDPAHLDPKSAANLTPPRTEPDSQIPPTPSAAPEPESRTPGSMKK